MKFLIAFVTVAACSLLAPSAQSQAGHVAGNLVSTLNGACDAERSYVTEGPIGADLTNLRSRFVCDSAVISFPDNRPGRMMIQFADKKSTRRQPLGFAGQFESKDFMTVERLYFPHATSPTPAFDGGCKTFFKSGRATDIVCGGVVDEKGRRTVANVMFHVTPGQ